MQEKNVQNEIRKILTEHRIGALSTMKGDQPYSRLMIFRYENDLLYTISSRKTGKVQDILENEKVHILLGIANGCFGKPYLEITATATIHDDKEMRDHFWHENFRKYLSGPDDPNYVVIRCKPKTIRLMNHRDFDGPVSIYFSE